RRRGHRIVVTKCPLLAQSGHPLLHRTCLLSGVKRTWTSAVHMSAFDPKRTLRRRGSSRYDDLSLSLEEINEATRIFHACWWCGGVAISRTCATGGQSARHRLPWFRYGFDRKSMGCSFCPAITRTGLDRRSHGGD